MSDEVPPLLPTVFVSYSSADRVAARALRDCLTAAGLEVWFDEEELGGGEAWDAKIRNQIRTCTYFMPVISASTETRREGYFRREWRFAVERTLDIADDVMFLLPVVIDDTRDTGARVPEKFFSVQWLRVPGGQPTPALRELARKLADGEADAGRVHVAPEAEPAASETRRARRKGEPPPFPRFPDYPEHGSRTRFIYDLVIWFGHLLRSLWFHLPRWLRVVAAAVILFNLIGWIFRERQAVVTTPKKPKSEVVNDVSKIVADAGSKLAKDGPAKAASALETLVGTAAEVAQAGRPVTLIPFKGDSEKEDNLADDVFEHLSDLLQQDDKPIWAISPLPLKPDAPDTEAISRGQRMKSRFVLAAHAGATSAGLPPGLVVRLFDVNQNELVWKETFALTDEPAAVARIIADEVTKRLGPAPATGSK